MTRHHNLPEILNLAQDKIIHPRDLPSLTGLSRTTIWRLMRAGKFPKSFHLSSGRVGWKMSDVTDWMSSLQQGA